MKNLLLLLFIIPLLAIAQDPKPIPYNADFRGYIQVQSQKDKTNKSLTNAVVCVDTATGKQYAVSMDSIGGNTDTTSLSNRINQKLNISDTTNMLSTYAHTWEMSTVDTTILATRLRVTQQVTDTAKVLRPLIYGKWGKTGNNTTFPNNILGNTGTGNLRIYSGNRHVATFDSTSTGFLKFAQSQAKIQFNFSANNYIKENSNQILVSGHNTVGFYVAGSLESYQDATTFAPLDDNLNDLGVTGQYFKIGYINSITSSGNAARSWGMARHTTSNTEGNSLTISSGGATSGATDKRGGNFILKSGTSTGNAASGIYFYSSDTLQGSGTTDRTPQLQASLDYRGLKLYNNATQFDDLQFPVGSLKSVGSADKPDYNTTDLGLLFPKNDTTERVGVIVQMPHSWKEGSSISPHVHWLQTSADTATWKIKYRVYNVGGTVPAWTIIASNNHAYTYTSGSIHQIAEFPDITMSGKTLSCIIDMIVYRKDNQLAGDALFKQFDIHIEKDGLGSQTESSKF